MKRTHLLILGACLASHLAGAENYLDLRARTGIAPGITAAEIDAPSMFIATGYANATIDMGTGPMPLTATIFAPSLILPAESSTEADVGLHTSVSGHYGFFVTDTFGFTIGTGLSLAEHAGDYESNYTVLDSSMTTLLTTTGSDYQAWGWDLMAGAVFAPTESLRVEGVLSYTRGRGEADAGKLSAFYFPQLPLDSYEYIVTTTGVPTVDTGNYTAIGLSATGLYTFDSGFTLGVDLGWQWATGKDTVTWDVLGLAQISGTVSGITVNESDVFMYSFAEERSLDAEGVTANLVLGYSF